MTNNKTISGPIHTFRLGQESSNILTEQGGTNHSAYIRNLIKADATGNIGFTSADIQTIKYDIKEISKSLQKMSIHHDLFDRLCTPFR